jgi:hypothetical protein
VPLSAHEFGHVRIGNDSTLAGLGSFSRPTLPAIEARILLADAFATRIMGPAYACSALLLRLEPWRAFDGPLDRLVAKRAAVILGMLPASSEALIDPYEAVTEDLAHEWHDAVRQCGSDEQLTGDEVADLDALIEAVRNAIGLPWSLAPSNADTVREWAKCLADGRPDEVDVNEVVEAPLRYVFNAAWIARLDAGGRRQAVDTITESILAIWERLRLSLRQRQPKSHAAVRPRHRLGTPVAASARNYGRAEDAPQPSG